MSKVLLTLLLCTGCVAAAPVLQEIPQEMCHYMYNLLSAADMVCQVNDLTPADGATSYHCITKDGQTARIYLGGSA